MRSTLYPKFILVYLVFGFLSIFTVATLTDNLIRSPLETQTASDMYQEATLVANDYLPRYFSGDITSGDIRLQLSGIETQLNAAVWFVDKDGQIISSAQSEGYTIAPSQVKDFDPAESGSAKSQTGDYHGYFDE